ncbi:MAG: hypothetical protein SGARI_000126 [Bacillariaceae sp.]
MDYQMALQRYVVSGFSEQWQESKGGSSGRGDRDRAEDKQPSRDDHHHRDPPRRDFGDRRSDSGGWGSGLTSLSRASGMRGDPHDRMRRDDRYMPPQQGPPPLHTLERLEPRRPGFGPPRDSMMVKRTGGGIQVGEHTGYLRMRGLPFSAGREDIYRFFEEYNPIADSIVLTFRSDGRATGEAYVGFETPDDSKQAMELHRKSMGTRYIELFLSNKDEHGRALARFGDR